MRISLTKYSSSWQSINRSRAPQPKTSCVLQKVHLKTPQKKKKNLTPGLIPTVLVWQGIMWTRGMSATVFVLNQRSSRIERALHRCCVCHSVFSERPRSEVMADTVSTVIHIRCQCSSSLQTKPWGLRGTRRNNFWGVLCRGWFCVSAETQDDLSSCEVSDLVVNSARGWHIYLQVKNTWNVCI